MRKLVVTLSATAAILLAGSLASKAQITRGAASLPAASQNFTPDRKSRVRAHHGRWCGPWHHRVCLMAAAGAHPAE